MTEAEKKEKKAPAKKAAAPKKEKAAKEGVKKSGKLVANYNFYDVIERPVVTEKSTALSEHNKVVFKVKRDAEKSEIKQAVEALFGVKVVKVNTINNQGKQKRFRGQLGKRQDSRKAIVTLEAGQSIDLAAGLK
jgi:large subunit ribosomal protein L23